jgi:hypothetical protein
MTGIVRTCLIALVGWIAAGVALHVYMTGEGLPGQPAIPVAIGASFCLVIAVNYVIAVFEVRRERALLAAAASGAPLADGKWVAVNGPIRSRELLRAPISGAECVAYEYRISREERAPRGGTREVSCFEGNALAPSSITTPQGTIQLLAVPRLDLPMRRIDVDDALENAIAFIQATSFETSATPKEQRITAVHESTDDDGAFRKDKSYGVIDLHKCLFDERFIQQGEIVCAFGRYSEARRAIVPHPNWAERARLMRGDDASTADQLRQKIRSHTFVAAGFTLAAWGIVLLYTNLGVQ